MEQSEILALMVQKRTQLRAEVDAGRNDAGQLTPIDKLINRAKIEIINELVLEIREESA